MIFKKIITFSILVLIFLVCSNFSSIGLPDDFVYLDEIDPTIELSPRYASRNNFIGRSIKGYEKPRIILTLQAAMKLKEVQAYVNQNGYSLVVYDGYRPQKAVDYFVFWSRDYDDEAAKALYYPTVRKSDLFMLGYIAERSAHTRGSTVDLTLILKGQKTTPIKIEQKTLRNGEKIPYLNDGTIDMGSSWDLFHRVSHHDSAILDPIYLENRSLLRQAMLVHGFLDYQKEWWHYTLAKEPFPLTYFDFDVE